MANPFKYRADHLGNMIVPEELQQARKGHAAGTIDDATLQQVEDLCIKATLRSQTVDTRLPILSDGEFRRPKAFNKALENVVADGWTDDSVAQLLEVARSQSVVVARELAFLKEHAEGHFKILLASPGHMIGKAYKQAPADKAKAIAAELAEKMPPIVREQIEMAIAAGTNYIQFENSAYATLLATNNHAGLQDRGFDPETVLDEIIAADTRAVQGFNGSEEYVIGQQLCRGGSQSWFRTEGHEALAKKVFTTLPVDRFNFKFDADVTKTDVHFLSWMAEGKTVALGLMDGKSDAVEDANHIMDVLDAAAELFPMEDTALYLQGGFRSHKVSDLSLQTAKLQQAVSIGFQYWGVEL